MYCTALVGEKPKVGYGDVVNGAEEKLEKEMAVKSDIKS